MNNRTKVKIRCKEHGVFEQTPDAHLRGSGCTRCHFSEWSNKLKLSLQEFKDRSNEIHNWKYDYSKVVLQNSTDDKVLIICPIHGEFQQIANSHLQGHGCRRCYDDKQRMGFKEFVRRANIAHNDKYSYNKVKLSSVANTVTITCPIHGDFTQQAYRHMSGDGCAKCHFDSLRISEEEVIKQFVAVHGNTYDYSNINYTTAYKDIDIVCKKHGTFKQNPQTHRLGSGCPSCAGYGFNRLIEGYIYILQSNEGVIKVGITNRDVALRVEEINRHSPYKFVSVFYKKLDGMLADKIESNLLLWLKHSGCTQPPHKFDGFTECFYQGNITLPQIINKLLKFETEVEDVRVI